MEHLLDYTFIYIILGMIAYFGGLFYIHNVKVNESADDGKLIEKYVILLNSRRK